MHECHYVATYTLASVSKELLIYLIVLVLGNLPCDVIHTCIWLPVYSKQTLRQISDCFSMVESNRLCMEQRTDHGHALVIIRNRTWKLKLSFYSVTCDKWTRPAVPSSTKGDRLPCSPTRRDTWHPTTPATLMLCATQPFREKHCNISGSAYMKSKL